MTTPPPVQPGQPYPPQYQPPQPPAKKRRKWPWVLLGIVVVLIVISAVSGGGDKKTEDTAAAATTAVAGNAAAGATQAAAPAKPAKAEPKAAGLNTAVRDGKFEFTVTGVENGLASVGDNPYLMKKAQGQFVIVTVSVTNTADKPQSFSPSSQKLKDTKGRSFESDSSAQIAVQSDIPVWDKINPGNTVTVKLVFDMPKDAVPATIELHDSMFSGGAKVSLS